MSEDERGLRDLMNEKFTSLHQLIEAKLTGISKHLESHIKHEQNHMVELDRRFNEHTVRLDRQECRIDSLESVGGDRAKATLKWIAVTIGGLLAVAAMGGVGYAITHWVQDVACRGGP